MKLVPFLALLLLSAVVFLFGWGSRETLISAGGPPRKVPAEADVSAIDDAEVLAAIRAVRDTDRSVRSAEAQHVLVQLSNGQKLPIGAVRHEASVLTDYGGQYVYDVLESFLLIPLKGGEELRIPIRKRFSRSRTLVEEIARLEDALATFRPWPGLYRLEDRVKDLKVRVNKVQDK